MTEAARRARFGVAGRLTVWLVASGAAAFTIFGYWNLRLHRQASEALVFESADRLSDLIRRSTRYQMLQNDRQALQQMIRDIGSEQGIRTVRIVNAAGQVSFSSDAGEVHRRVPTLAEGSRIFTNPSGQRVLALSRRIENQESCSTAACHAHPPDQKVLGMIDTHLSLAGVDERLAREQSLQRAFTVIVVLLISVISATFVWAVVYRPVKELIQGTRRVAGGELAYRLPVRSNDELGELAASFNSMTADLAAAHVEITSWAHSLEERAERKSRELERAHAVLATSEKMAAIGKLAATVAHEVNNPLFGILTYARLGLKELEKTDFNGGARSHVIDQLRIIERESKRCGGIIKNLLTFSRQSPGKREPADINILVDRALVLIRHQLELSSIELVNHRDKAALQVICDAGQIQQVVLALLVNATEAMPNGGRLEVSTQSADAGSRVEVRVKDNGSGIPADVLPHIFEPFFTTKEDQQRNGLGLAVAWNIVEQHGGTIRVRSTGREGTEFTVTLPAGEQRS